MQVAILGRQPNLSLGELECLFGAEKVTPLADYAALINIDKPLPQSLLGGSMKTGTVLAKIPNSNLEKAFDHIKTTILDQLVELPEGKLQFGVSIYGFKAQKNWLLRQMLELKQVIKKSGRSVRIIENKSEALEAAQVLYNKLTGPFGRELLIIKDGANVILAQTTAVQNIDEYAARDHGRPKRDAFVGMLPPKLAQIIINLAFDPAKPNPDNHRLQMLDPFCGTGVVLQEALLMGYDVFGSDLSQKMIDYTKINLGWLTEKYADVGSILTIQQADATSHQWREANIIDAVVCETYLGKPLSSLPEKNRLEAIVAEANTIAEGFLSNIAAQLKSGTRLTVALPAWYLGNSSFRHLLVLDHLEQLGYNRLDLVHATKKDLIYHRENQVVARELTILEKK